MIRSRQDVFYPVAKIAHNKGLAYPRLPAPGEVMIHLALCYVLPHDASGQVGMRPVFEASF